MTTREFVPYDKENVDTKERRKRCYKGKLIKRKTKLICCKCVCQCQKVKELLKKIQLCVHHGFIHALSTPKRSYGIVSISRTLRCMVFLMMKNLTIF